MIIQIRGTSGSGKSTAVRALIELAARKASVKAPKDFPAKRKNPVGYTLEFNGGSKPVAILGHYETACGGVDTLPSYDFIFGMIRHFHAEGFDVVFEGLLAAHDKKQCTALWEGIGKKDLTILELIEPLQVCLDSVKARRAARGADPDTFNPDNTVRRYKEVVSSCLKLEAIGIPVHRVGRGECLEKMLELLDVRVSVAA